MKQNQPFNVEKTVEIIENAQQDLKMLRNLAEAVERDYIPSVDKYLPNLDSDTGESILNDYKDGFSGIQEEALSRIQSEMGDIIISLLNGLNAQVYPTPNKESFSPLLWQLVCRALPFEGQGLRIHFNTESDPVVRVFTWDNEKQKFVFKSNYTEETIYLLFK